MVHNFASYFSACFSILRVSSSEFSVRKETFKGYKEEKYTSST